jgi:hypothetical protein
MKDRGGNMVCPICEETMKTTDFPPHIRTNHPALYQPLHEFKYSVNGPGQKLERNLLEYLSKQSSQIMDTLKDYVNTLSLSPEPIRAVYAARLCPEYISGNKRCYNVAVDHNDTAQFCSQHEMRHIEDVKNKNNIGGSRACIECTCTGVFAKRNIARRTFITYFNRPVESVNEVPDYAYARKINGRLYPQPKNPKVGEPCALSITIAHGRLLPNVTMCEWNIAGTNELIVVAMREISECEELIIDGEYPVISKEGLRQLVTTPEEDVEAAANDGIDVSTSDANNSLSCFLFASRYRTRFTDSMLCRSCVTTCVYKK